jgi:MFS family permease
VSRVSAGDPARRPGLWPDLAPWRSSRGFRLLFASRTVIALGAQASEVALLVQAKQLTGSPLAVGLLGVVELVPLVVFGLYGGVLADRFDRRPGNGGCPAAQGSAGHRADGVLGRPVPTQGNDMKADKDRKILSV